MSQAHNKSSIQLTQLSSASNTERTNKGANDTSTANCYTFYNGQSQQTQVINPISQDAGSTARRRTKPGTRPNGIHKDDKPGISKCRRQIRTSISQAVNELPSGKESKDPSGDFNNNHCELDGRNERIHFNIARFIRIFLYHALYPVSLPALGYFEGTSYLKSVRLSTSPGRIALRWVFLFFVPTNDDVCRCLFSQRLWQILLILTFSR